MNEDDKTMGRVLAQKRVELRMMEMGAQLQRTLSRPVVDPAVEIEVLRKQFGIIPVNTLEITVLALCRIPLIKWVREVAPDELNVHYDENKGEEPGNPRMTKMGLRKAKEIVEAWIGPAIPEKGYSPEKLGQTVQITVPLDWDMTVPMPEVLKVVY